MTEIMPVPRELNFTVLPAESFLGRRFDASEGSGLQIHEVVDHIKDVDGFELLIGTEL